MNQDLEARLLLNFRRYHRLRRIKKAALVSTLAAASALIIFLRPTAPQEPPAEFYPLPGETITAAMLDTSQIVHVALTPAALVQLGLPAQSEPVEAELLLTHEGVPRGIRFIP